MSGILRLDIDPAKLAKYGLKRRQIQEHTREALAAMGREWHARFMPRHFEESAYERYGYYQRKGMGLTADSRAFRRSYAGRKIRRFYHNKPLVFTGETFALARLLKLRVTSKQARVILPPGLNRKHPKSRISMRDEVTRLLPDEARELLEVGRRTFRESIARPPAGA